MDPLSVLSIAAAVVAFIDFGAKLVGAAQDHLKRDDADDVETALADLARIPRQLKVLSHGIEQAQASFKSSASRNPDLENVLVMAVDASTAVLNNIDALISTLQVDNENRKNASLRRHLFNAAKGGESAYSEIEKKLRSANSRIGNLQAYIMSVVMSCLWYVGAVLLGLGVGR